MAETKECSHWRIRLPSGYTLWHHVDGTASDEKNARRDAYLYGEDARLLQFFPSRLTSLSQGSATRSEYKVVFRSPAEFAPHFMWLMHGRPEGGCRCRYCSGRKQGEVSSELFGYPLKSPTGGTMAGRMAGSQRAKRVKKKKPADQPIIAKDYRQGNLNVPAVEKLGWCT